MSIIEQSDQFSTDSGNSCRSTTSSIRSGILRSVHGDMPPRLGEPAHVSFADTVATIHVVDNLKLTLSPAERFMVWDMPDRNAESFGFAPQQPRKQNRGGKKFSPIKFISSRLGRRKAESSSKKNGIPVPIPCQE